MKLLFIKEILLWIQLESDCGAVGIGFNFSSVVLNMKLDFNALESVFGIV